MPSPIVNYVGIGFIALMAVAGTVLGSIATWKAYDIKPMPTHTGTNARFIAHNPTSSHHLSDAFWAYSNKVFGSGAGVEFATSAGVFPSVTGSSNNTANTLEIFETREFTPEIYDRDESLGLTPGGYDKIIANSSRIHCLIWKSAAMQYAKCMYMVQLRFQTSGNTVMPQVDNLPFSSLRQSTGALTKIHGKSTPLSTNNMFLECENFAMVPVAQSENSNTDQKVRILVTDANTTPALSGNLVWIDGSVIIDINPSPATSAT